MKRNLFLMEVFLVLAAALFPVLTRGAEAPAPFVTAPVSETAPVIDGVIGEAEWREAAMLQDFLNAEGGSFASEQTAVWLKHDEGSILMAFRMSEFALNPASNMTTEFKAELHGENKPVWEDDCVEIRITPPGKTNVFFYLGFNANAATFSSAPEGFPKDWARGAAIKARKCEKGFWEAEVSIPKSALGIGPEKEAVPCNFNIVRFEKRLGEKSSWARLRNGRHDDPSTFAAMRLGGREPGIKFAAFSKSGAGEIPLEFYSPGKWEGECLLFSGGIGEDAKARTSKIILSAGMGKVEAMADMAGGGAFERRVEVNGPSGALFFRSPTHMVEGRRNVIQFESGACKGVEIFFNGKKVSGEGPETFKSGMNVLAVKARAKSEFLFRASAENKEILSDGSWRSSETPGEKWDGALFDDSRWARADSGILEGRPSLKSGGSKDTFFRKPILFDSTALVAPGPDKKIFHLTRGGAYYLTWDVLGAKGLDFEKPVDDYRLFLLLPEGLEMTGASNRIEYPQGYAPLAWPSETNMYEWRMLEPRKVGGENYSAYEIRRTLPLQRNKMPLNYQKAREKCVIGIKALRETDKAVPMFYHASAFDNHVEEIPGSMHVRVLPELKVRQPGSVKINMLLKELDYVPDTLTMSELFRTLKSAGVNEIHWRGGNNLPQKEGIRCMTTFNMEDINWHHGILDMRQLFQKFPASRAVQFDGNPAKWVNMLHVAENPDTWPILDRLFYETKKTTPSLDILFFDYEFAPFPGEIDLPLYTCFSKETLKRFREKFEIAEELTPQVVREKYPGKWVDFRCWELGMIAPVLKKLANKNGMEFVLYSGYQSPETRRLYTIDWDHIGRNVDRAYMGYGCNKTHVEDTKKALENVPMVFGVLNGLDSAATMMRRVVDSGGGGLLCWYEKSYNGKDLSELAKVTSLVSEFEEIITKGERADFRCKIVSGTSQDNIAVYQLGDSLLALIMNEERKDAGVVVRLASAKGMVSEFYTGKTFASGDKIALDVPAGQTRALFVKAKK